MTDLFDDNVVGGRDNDDPERMVFLDNMIEVLEGKKTKFVNNVVTITIFTPLMNVAEKDSTSVTVKLCYQMSKITSDSKLHSSRTPIGDLLV